MIITAPVRMVPLHHQQTNVPSRTWTRLRSTSHSDPHIRDDSRSTIYKVAQSLPLFQINSIIFSTQMITAELRSHRRVTITPLGSDRIILLRFATIARGDNH